MAMDMRTMSIELADEVSPLSVSAMRELAISVRTLQRRSSARAQQGSLERLASVASSGDNPTSNSTMLRSMALLAEPLDVRAQSSNSHENLSVVPSREASPKPRRRSAPVVPITSWLAPAVSEHPGKSPSPDLPGALARLIRAGKAAKTREELELAVDKLRRALDRMQHSKGGPAKRNILINLGLCLERMGNHKDALECYNQSLDILPEEDRQTKAIIHQHMGLIHEAQKCWSEAENCYLAALEMYEMLENPQGCATCKFNLGCLAVNQEKVGDGMLYLEDALAHRQFLSPSEVHLAATYLANLHLQQKRFTDAESLAALEVSSLPYENDRMTHVEAVHHLALVLIAQQRTTDAVARFDALLDKIRADLKVLRPLVHQYDEAGRERGGSASVSPCRATESAGGVLAVRELAEAEQAYLRALDDGSVVCSAAQQWHKAIQYTQQSLPLLQNDGDAHVKALRRLGLLHICCDDFKTALKYFIQEREHRMRRKEEVEYARASYYAGHCMVHKGRNESARDMLQEALVICRRTGLHLLEITVLHELAKAFCNMNKPAEAMSFLDEASAIAGRKGHRREKAKTLLAKAEVHMLCSRHLNAIETLEVALVLCENNNLHDLAAETLMHMAQVHQGMGNVDEAITVLQKSVHLSLEDSRSSSSFVLSGLALLGELQLTKCRPSEALSCFRRAIELSKTKPTPTSVTFRLQFGAARALQHLGQFIEATQVYEQALATARMPGCVGGKLFPVYVNLATCQLEARHWDTALVTLTAIDSAEVRVPAGEEWYVAFLRGQVRFALMQFDIARQFFQDAISMLEREGSTGTVHDKAAAHMALSRCVGHAGDEDARQHHEMLANALLASQIQTR
ncbi:hypothetical protein PTSG_04202 [Salpingoeca rosetta]|uniref:MalT-like TPR region domain-containing protein n=1 Tax=Salpingoeca rosetta (strain ATCC 50818 / BSB-021) TaxID=946362 RepID=F2U6W2_SALR5|nr:uncharacterized protein PTSG_04202 [Salpingoeca rosetta]EGD83594.1 hypothetical protein PTSG_04202 [Salpingoeca rosetta]|eukprot:XP_004995098.1 hypothetical protein PTSG_04202 [Salpingoeca rosetta]